MLEFLKKTTMCNSKLKNLFKYSCRYLKGDKLFPGSVATVAPTGLGTVGVAGSSNAISAAAEGELESGVGEVIEDGAVKPAPPTLRARIVGQGYKQARRQTHQPMLKFNQASEKLELKFWCIVCSTD